MSDHFSRLDEADFPPFDPGSVWLVGAGPGSPGLITLLGYYAMGQADVVVHDALVSPSLLKRVKPGAELIHAGKRGGRPSANQADITERLIELAGQGKRVLRLKGGDPYVFGRGGEEARRLFDVGIPFRVVPGITAGIGGLAYAGIPATHRDTNQSVVFLTGHDSDGQMPHTVDWAEVATAAPVIVMYMAVKHLPQIAARLLEAGREPDDDVALVSNATLGNQTIMKCSLGALVDPEKSRDVETPAIVVVGPVTALTEQLDWFRPHLRGHDFA